ncbi:MAG TPA: hypothetical protein VGM33_11615 [Baekduia sp.]|jgi:hypothetical protein
MAIDDLVRQLQGHWRWGTGDPEGVVAAPVGVVWLREDGGAGSTMYVKESGGSGPSGWVAK